MSKASRPSASRSVFEPQAYTLEGPPLLVDNSGFERALVRRAALLELKKEREVQARERALRLVRERVRLRAEEMVLARERREEEARALVDGGPVTVPAELVKDEADAILREADEKLRAATDRESEAAALLLEARRMADGLVEEARSRAAEEAAAAREASREEGFREGREDGAKKGFDEGVASGTLEGLKEGRQRFEAAARAVEGMLESFPAQAERSMGELQSGLAGTAMEIARRVLAVELSQNAEAVAGVAAEALREVRDRSKVVLRVNPEDITACRAHRDEFLAVLGAGSFLRIQEDEGVERGGCLIETQAGRLDATVPARVRAAAEAAGLGGEE